jgi:hypothetical protein
MKHTQLFTEIDFILRWYTASHDGSHLLISRFLPCVVTASPFDIR